jgi:hypothetical protein
LVGLVDLADLVGLVDLADLVGLVDLADLVGLECLVDLSDLAYFILCELLLKKKCKIINITIIIRRLLFLEISEFMENIAYIITLEFN